MNILVGVTGSIAAYKIYDLVKEFSKNNHHVRVILTKNASHFVQPHVFKLLGAQECYSSNDDFTDTNFLHIQLAKWANVLLVAPLSASTLAKISHGEASDLLTTTILAMPVEKKIILSPAMNPTMWMHPAVQKNWLDVLSWKHVRGINPVSGIVACKDEGVGKLPSLYELYFATLEQAVEPKKSKNHILLTAGATQSPLDPIRYLTNGSTGQLGYHIAAQFMEAGYHITAILGPSAKTLFQRFQCCEQINIISVTTAEEMLSASILHFNNANLVICSAAVNDISFEASSSKLKKVHLKESLPIIENPDILKNLIQLKSHQKFIGFAAEAPLNEEVLCEKIQKKPVDLLIGNQVSQTQGFGDVPNDYWAMENNMISWKKYLSKDQLAKELAIWWQQQ
jgi:phosphopantothenoylcysteine decarboxylase/phosphopantothenate--cysteine ligase